MRGVSAKFLFRSFIRSHFVNIITRVDVWYPGNERRVIRPLTAVVGGRVRENPDIRFGWHLCS